VLYYSLELTTNKLPSTLKFESHHCLGETVQPYC